MPKVDVIPLPIAAESSLRRIAGKFFRVREIGQRNDNQERGHAEGRKDIKQCGHFFVDQNDRANRQQCGPKNRDHFSAAALSLVAFLRFIIQTPKLLD